MKRYTGISASKGISIGKAFLYQDDEASIPKFSIKHDDITQEMNRFEEAVGKAVAEIEDIKKKTDFSSFEGSSHILDAHILMLRDPDLSLQIQKMMTEILLNVEWVLQKVMDNLIQKMNSFQDSYLRERSLDFNDISRRVLNHLMDRDLLDLSNLKEDIILVAHNLMPSDAVAMRKEHVKGMALDVGSKTSHTAILARSFEIPAVLGLGSISEEIQNRDLLIIDGNNGIVIVDPDQATLDFYQSHLQEWQRKESQLLYMNELSAETKDGKLIYLKGNIEVPEEVDSIFAHGADGVGLYRSEFLFLSKHTMPSEEEQYKAYTSVLKGVGGKAVTIRTLDVGGDKILKNINIKNENNPILGWRAIRFCLSEPDIFKTQLRALLRASISGNLQIMFPMISGIEELERALAILEEVKYQLKREGIPYRDNIPIGSMIEVPSAAMTTEIIAKKVDFLSIGTNDLIQYTLAVDRGNEKVAYLYEPFHPGVLRLLKIIIEGAHSQGITAGMCGEMAGDPLATVILLGLGLDEFSMSAYMIPKIKGIIRSTSLLEAEELVGNVMLMRSSREIDKHVRRWMEERFDIT
ncbi:phosphoenolpyruvate--protein phosphotransferase [Spirochaeta cellobiosiphila]|uniref:phosphoenolpyruvate--protein phosphotransferase n=1 Tax=Spirochaeta cellobiosiphila TaxID=504483 RepID=UPI00048D99FC|nr:phosphoenolpyruvate--protein phosphotransferase [Spirochaeta cellobiosiphila]